MVHACPGYISSPSAQSILYALRVTLGAVMTSRLANYHHALLFRLASLTVVSGVVLPGLWFSFGADAG
jgi:hypothetical protein